MPNVHVIEVAIFAGALLVFSVLPAVFQLATNLRRRVPQAPAPGPAASANLPAEGPVATESGMETELTMEATLVVSEEMEAIPGALPESVRPAAEESDEGEHSFCLDDLRHARALETPDREALRDPDRQRAWEEGIRLAETHAAEIGRTQLSASFEPQAQAFHDMRQAGELRFLLFSTLWPSATDEATAEAVFEIGPAGVTEARVVRRPIA